ncbi:hypothetical protein OCS_05216 [Ophiocordyceps sinensis CO18]|uniref:Uncharacterized protein n=1 Tax=Ophiocordyceps sinensis (strain Co18 / CGMCC 3.14243) TaxID=911162 RepID=T5AB63_OPHSC|nr:hypothetical protein OCS_05216 [Ophiocordyceps sinensis CO18]
MATLSQADTQAATELPKFKRRPTRFNGSFEFSGKFRGWPSPLIDHEWDRFTHNRKAWLAPRVNLVMLTGPAWIDGTSSLIAVNEDDIKGAKPSDQAWLNTTVEYGEVNGGGYMATLELFHQLHCLVEHAT